MKPNPIIVEQIKETRKHLHGSPDHVEAMRPLWDAYHKTQPDMGCDWPAIAALWDWLNSEETGFALTESCKGFKKPDFFDQGNILGFEKLENEE